VLAGILCPMVSGVHGTLSLSATCSSDEGSTGHDQRSDGLREDSFSRDGVSGSRAELRPGHALMVRVRARP
ncbi:hypothetical protein F5148DRAFT_1227391, partial [Russula earlei]